MFIYFINILSFFYILWFINAYSSAYHDFKSLFWFFMRCNPRALKS